MNHSTNPYTEREARILDAAAALIQRQGYDKTTMSEIADEAGVSRGILYLHFANKDALFEALLMRELLRYSASWIEYIEADPQGGTLGGLFRAVLYAVNQNPFMTAISKRDRRVFGNYLRKPDNLLLKLGSPASQTEFVQEMQEAGAIRKDVSAAMIVQLSNILSYGVMGMYGVEEVDNSAQYDELMTAMAEMLDRFLLPEGGADREAGKAVIRRLAHKARSQLEQLRQSREAKANEASPRPT
ncbi:MAG TPA: helix-turn-helix domain-containing protein [Caldilineaceae bacterium]|nr:helix-turn-helix domain-containing protein [Caldilineaceae bacterium]